MTTCSPGRAALRLYVNDRTHSVQSFSNVIVFGGYFTK